MLGHPNKSRAEKKSGNRSARAWSSCADFYYYTTFPRFCQHFFANFTLFVNPKSVKWLSSERWFAKLSKRFRDKNKRKIIVKK